MQCGNREMKPHENSETGRNGSHHCFLVGGSIVHRGDRDRKKQEERKRRKKDRLMRVSKLSISGAAEAQADTAVDMARMYHR